ncbi:right-handed parallel beta-helix repeat-containing protein, partial [Patescibacteria group bacterium]|nr:right-handed parallel beta-helix repeat-containing protein [Patescibacteria group bacterium]
KYKMKKILFFICAFILLVPTLIQAATLCVWQGGADAGNCQSCASTSSACASINYALTQTVTASDTIWASGNLSAFSVGAGDSGASAANRKSIIRWPGEVRPVINGGGSVQEGIEIFAADHIYIQDFEVKDHTMREVWIRAAASDIVMETISVNKSDNAGFEIASSFDVSLIGPEVKNNDGYGIYAFDPATNNPSGLTINKGTVSTNSKVNFEAGMAIDNWDDVTIKNTYFGQQGQSFLPSLTCHTTASNVNIWNNSFYQNRIEIGTAAGPCSNTNYRNNAHYRNAGAGEMVVVDGNSTGTMTVDYNDIYATGGASIGRWAGTTATSLAHWQTLTGQSVNSIDQDPLYENPTIDGLGLSAGSPAIDEGVTIASVLVDHKGLSRPQGPAYDIGADERLEDQPGVPEFTLFTLMLALFAGLGVIILISKINKSHSALN